MPIAIDQIIRSRRKTIALVMSPEGSLTVRAPVLMGDGDIQKFILAHTDWILKNQAKIRRNPPVPKKQYAEGEIFLYLGKLHPLKIVPGKSPALALRSIGFCLAINRQPQAAELFQRWYRKQARQVITNRVAAIARQHGFNYTKLRISSARTRWGSCSSKGTLSFTWRLIMAPAEIIDYVVVHELVHTKVKNHSKTFWGTLAKIMPEYKQYVRWLKQNGKYLSL